MFLDYGCGTGCVLKIARNLYDVYGVELDEFRIKKAREKLGDVEGKKIINFYRIDELDFRGKFDIVHSNQNIEHLLEPMPFLKKFYEWLKPGGILYICAPSSDSFAFSFLGKINSMATLGHVSLFSKKSMVYALQSTGFEQIVFSYTNIIDVTSTEFWKRIFGIDFLHRHSFINSKLLITILYPFMLITEGILYILILLGILRGNYFYVFARKPKS